MPTGCSAPPQISTPPVGFEMSTPDKLPSPTRGVGVRIRGRGRGVLMRGAGVRMMGGSVGIPSSEAASSEQGVSNRRLRTINGKVVRMRGKGDGSKAHMYPGGIKPIGFGLSWDPVDGEPMLGNTMGMPAPAWPIGITPEDVRVHAERTEPVVEQEPMLEPLVRRNAEYQRRMAAQRKSQPVERRQSERIKQIIFNRPPSPGPGLNEDDAISLD